MPSKTVIDIDGSEAVSKILRDLLNKFPGLTTGNKSILFSTLSDASGIGFFPISGAALQNSTEDVTGHVTQVCHTRSMWSTAPLRNPKLSASASKNSLMRWASGLSGSRSR